MKKLSKSPPSTPTPTAASFPLPPSRTIINPTAAAAAATKAATATAITTTTATTATTVPQPPPPILSTLNDRQPLPRLIVFDLDYTLWPFWVDTHVTPPLKPHPSHLSVHDKHAESFALYPDISGILYSLRAAGIKIAGASRTQAPELAREMLKLLHVPPLRVSNEEAVGGGAAWMAGVANGKARKAVEYFDHLEIYPGSKITHFERIRRASGVEYGDMLFFDDESRNREVERLGVTMWLVRDGVTRKEVDEGVKEWRRRREPGLGPLGRKAKEEL